MSADALNAAVLAAIDKLPPFDREVVHRRYAMCEPFSAIAAAMRVTTEQIKQAHERALLVIAAIEP